MTQKYLSTAESNTDHTGRNMPVSSTLEELKMQHGQEVKPLINLSEVQDAFILEVAAPGLEKKSFIVSMDDNVLTIAALDKEASEITKKYHQHEFNYSCFKRDLVIPGNVDADFLSAVYADGVLCIRMPKCNKRQRNKIEQIMIY